MTAGIKLISSLVLTRLLNPAAYGVFGILLSLLFIIELVSDVGTTALLIRHPRGRERVFVHTIWTIRLARSCINFLVMFFGAPLIAYIYHAPLLTPAFRLISLQFPIAGLESMAFVIAQRDQRARIANYAEMLTNTVMTAVVIVLAATVMKSYYALIYGTLIQRVLLTLSSHLFYRDIGIGFAFDREAAIEQFRFARFVMPSSIVTIFLSQYDKVVLLRLFDFSLLGLYTIAGNMLGPITGVITHNARVILYARCAEYFRRDPKSVVTRYYHDNRRLMLLGIILPATLAGLSQVLVTTLYDPRYAMAGSMLTILGIGGIFNATLNASENLLVASGQTHMVLTGNIIRLLTIAPATILGYYLFGFYGFVWFAQVSMFVTSLYFLYRQHKAGLLSARNEILLLATGLGVFLLCLVFSHMVMALVPHNALHFHIHRR
jgi:O-antigen/teichoic acid export membrane protein